MDFDLTRGLRDLSDQPAVPDEAVPVGAVLARVRRARALRNAGVGVASTAAVVALAVAVQTAPFREEPAPPADPTRSASPTPDLSEPTPTEVPDAPPPTEAPVEPVANRPLVASTSDGRLVVLDPETGSELSEVPTGLAPLEIDGVTVSPDGGTAYFQSALPTEHGYPIYRVPLGGGSAELVTHGRTPSLSPDGDTLAFVAPAPGAPPDVDSSGVHLLELATGTVRYLPDEDFCRCDRVVTTPEWSPDGQHIAIGLGYGERLSDVDIVVVDLADAPSLQAGRILPRSSGGANQFVTRPLHVYMPDGRLAVASLSQLDDHTLPGEDVLTIELVDPSTGAVTQTLSAPAGSPRDLSVAADGQTLLLTTERYEDDVPRTLLHRWDGTTFVGLAEGVLGTAW
ncbi:PD40 domain-containing protein [Actinotalea ferrariae]|uniref:WD40 repeat domain-containing protein n=1 Tax=Actinotalea ferrariae TaxID=1386098 RepID=UPI001C8C0CD7|nr:hypothetical protein [Actinotalea ferrariae]MBX9245673.1 PD40 domain-containing protein [Actinotalea ferrariae]